MQTTKVTEATEIVTIKTETIEVTIITTIEITVETLAVKTGTDKMVKITRISFTNLICTKDKEDNHNKEVKHK